MNHPEVYRLKNGELLLVPGDVLLMFLHPHAGLSDGIRHGQAASEAVQSLRRGAAFIREEKLLGHRVYELADRWLLVPPNADTSHCGPLGRVPVLPDPARTTAMDVGESLALRWEETADFIEKQAAK